MSFPPVRASPYLFYSLPSRPFQSAESASGNGSISARFVTVLILHIAVNIFMVRKKFNFSRPRSTTFSFSTQLSNPSSTQSETIGPRVHAGSSRQDNSQDKTATQELFTSCSNRAKYNLCNMHGASRSRKGPTRTQWAYPSSEGASAPGLSRKTGGWCLIPELSRGD